MADVLQTKRALRLEFEDGMTETGKLKVKTQTFSNIKNTATQDNLLVISKAIDGLTKKDIHKTKEILTNEINDQKGDLENG